MILYIPVNDTVEGESQTIMKVDLGDVSERVGKRKFRTVLTTWGIPKNQQKSLIREYFNGNSKSVTSIPRTR